jgi:hypothetical protein
MVTRTDRHSPKQRSATDDGEPQLAADVIFAFWRTRAIWLAAHLRLADAIGAGPAALESIAKRSGTEPAPLKRLLDALAAEGLFTRLPDGRYAGTDRSSVLRSDHPRSQRAMIDVIMGHEHYGAWGAAASTLKTGVTAFNEVYGASWIEFYNSNPIAGRDFAEAMSGSTRAFEDAIVAAAPFGSFELAVDVGGSHGSLLRRILADQPQARGIVFDLPGVIEGIPAEFDDMDGRLTTASGDFFVGLPSGGDLYLLKFILHDWDQAHARAILRSVRQAIRPGGRIALVETVLPDDTRPHPGWLMDINMLTVTGGKERSAAEYCSLLASEGFRFEDVVPTASPLSVVRAVATS